MFGNFIMYWNSRNLLLAVFKILVEAMFGNFIMYWNSRNLLFAVFKILVEGVSLEDVLHHQRPNHEQITLDLAYRHR